MAFDGLVAELKRLIRERVPDFQAKESVEAFDSAPFLLKVRSVSSSRTFGSRMSEEHKDGQTMVCEWEGHDLQVALMMLPSANDWVRERSKGEEFDVLARLFSYDTLYDRAIFGQVVEGADEEAESVPVELGHEPVVNEAPLPADEIIRQSVCRNTPAKLPRRAKTCKVSQRKLYRKSTSVAAPERDKRMFWGKPRKLKFSKKPSKVTKRTGHLAPTRKPLNRILRKSGPRPGREKIGNLALRGILLKGTVRACPPKPAEVVEILKKKHLHGEPALSSSERHTFERAGLGPKNDIGFGMLPCLLELGHVIVAPFNPLHVQFIGRGRRCRLPAGWNYDYCPGTHWVFQFVKPTPEITPIK